MREEKVAVRKMTPGDISRILEIDQKLSGKQRSPSWPQRVARYLEMSYLPLCHVAEVNGKVVGFILGDIRGWEYAIPLSGWIDVMGITPEFQGQGIGTELVEAFAAECRKLHIETRIMVREPDERLRRFMTEIGFHRGELIELVK